ncbi:MAG: High-affinity zinc uptake system rane protein ZnuB [Verrucomicrobiota bacterium]|jgi:ABC-type Mn2+/Zn2+ transport system permease subunit
MNTVREVLTSEFLRNSVYISLLVGVACPLVGVHLILRRMVFLGVALPQISSCGIAAAFALHAWHIIPHLEGQSEQHLAFFGSSAFTLVAILVLSLLERRGRALVEGRIGAAYALAGAWSILLLVANPFGEHGLLDRLKGEIIAVTDEDLAWTAGTFGLVVFALWLFQKEFMLVSFDRDMALTLKKNVLGWDTLLFLLMGVTISMSVLNVGPLVTFGFLILPPLIARVFASTMRQFAVAACLIGSGTAFAGFCLAYRLDVPAGPTDIALLGCLYAAATGGRKLWPLLRRRPAAGPREP